jgi:very-short-patch-repair endonuclease
MIDYKEFEEKFNIKIIFQDNEPLFNPQSVAECLQIQNIRSTTKNFDWSVDKKKVKYITNGGIQTINFLTLHGLKKLLVITKKTSSIILASYLGFDIFNCKKLDVETETINIIQKVFKGENMITQYETKKCGTINKYRIDLYFPDYKLAVECDESYHNTEINMYFDKERESKIINKLGCSFIRYSPESKNFDIFNIINEIFKHIKSFR